MGGTQTLICQAFGTRYQSLMHLLFATAVPSLMKSRSILDGSSQTVASNQLTQLCQSVSPDSRLDPDCEWKGLSAEICRNVVVNFATLERFGDGSDCASARMYPCLLNGIE